MSVCFDAEFVIGGQVPKKLVRKLCSAIASAKVALDWGEARFAPTTAKDLTSVLEEIDGVALLRLCDEEARSGQFATLEGFLERYGIPYDRHSDGVYEYDPDLVQFRPGMNRPLVVVTNKSRSPVVERSEVQAILALVEKGHSRQAIRKLRHSSARTFRRSNGFRFWIRSRRWPITT